jgi:transcriptional regulator GlxA family with amidase domain
MSPGNWITQVRVARAKDLLEHSSLAIEQVAFSIRPWHRNHDAISFSQANRLESDRVPEEIFTGDRSRILIARVDTR